MILPKSEKGFSHILIIIILAIAIPVGVYLVKHPQIFKSRAQSLNTGEYDKIRSVTFYNFPYNDLHKSHQFVDDLENALPKIKAIGLNTIWFVIELNNFFQEDLQTLNPTAVQNFKESLDILRANNVKAILPLSYINNPDPCRVLQDNNEFRKYTTEIENFLRAFTDYADMSYVVIFTEGTWECLGSRQYITRGRELADMIRPTFGDIPNQLPKDLREKFLFGFYDLYISSGWTDGDHPTMSSPTTYDFFLSGRYFDNSNSDDEITGTLSDYINRQRQVYPAVPIVFGEAGSPLCDNGGNEQTQARIMGTFINYLQSQNIGFNYWMWNPINYREPDAASKDCDYGKHSITRVDGSLRSAGEVVKSIIQRHNWTLVQKTPIPTPLPTSTPSSRPTTASITRPTSTPTPQTPKASTTRLSSKLSQTSPFPTPTPTPSSQPGVLPSASRTSSTTPSPTELATLPTSVPTFTTTQIPSPIIPSAPQSSLIVGSSVNSSPNPELYYLEKPNFIGSANRKTEPIPNSQNSFFGTVLNGINTINNTLTNLVGQALKTIGIK